MRSFERLTPKLLLRVISFQRRPYTDHVTLSYAKALKMIRCEGIETNIRKRSLLSAGGVARQCKERLPGRGIFGTMAGGENAGPGGQSSTWHGSIVEDLGEFRDTKGSAELAPLGVYS